MLRQEPRLVSLSQGPECMHTIAGIVRTGFLPEVLDALSGPTSQPYRICGEWVDVLPSLPCLASDTTVLSKSTRALATLIGSKRKSLSPSRDVESPQNYYDAIHTLRGQIASKGLSLELLPAIMCLTLVEVS